MKLKAYVSVSYSSWWICFTCTCTKLNKEVLLVGFLLSDALLAMSWVLANDQHHWDSILEQSQSQIRLNLNMFEPFSFTQKCHQKLGDRHLESEFQNFLGEHASRPPYGGVGFANSTGRANGPFQNAAQKTILSLVHPWTANYQLGMTTVNTREVPQSSSSLPGPAQLPSLQWPYKFTNSLQFSVSIACGLLGTVAH